MANYKRGPWDEQLEGLLDISACCGVAHEELAVCHLLDHEKDRHEEAGYRYLRAIHREPESPDVKAWAEAALNHFAEAERLETLIEGHVHNGGAGVVGANNRAVSLTPNADGQRRLTAEAQKEESLTLTLPQAANLLNIGVGVARAKFNTGEIPGQIALSRRKVVSRQVLTDWIATEGASSEAHPLTGERRHLRAPEVTYQ